MKLIFSKINEIWSDNYNNKYKLIETGNWRTSNTGLWFDLQNKDMVSGGPFKTYFSNILFGGWRKIS